MHASGNNHRRRRGDKLFDPSNMVIEFMMLSSK